MVKKSKDLYILKNNLLKMTKPIILEHMTDDFILKELFGEIITHNLDGEDQKFKELTPEICKITPQLLEGIVGNLLLQNKNDGVVYKGVNYGRLNEGYAGPLLHLMFQEPITDFSITYVSEFEKGKRINIKGNSEDALYFFEDAVIDIGGEEYIVKPNTFVFLKNNSVYSITSLSKDQPNITRIPDYPKIGQTPKGVIISRFGDQERILKQEVSEFKLEKPEITCQWGLMYFIKDKTLKAHLHEQKDEFFYFFDKVGMDTNIENLDKILYIPIKGIVPVDKGNIHSMQTNYGDAWFHSINIPAKMGDSKRV